MPIPAAQTDTSFDATLAGPVDGTNAIFTLRSTPLADYPVRGYRNGVRLTTGADYTVSGTSVTMLAPQIPAAGDSLVFDYFISAVAGAPVGVGDLTTLANVKAMANVTSADDDALLQRLISAESSRFQKLIDRTLGTATYTETRDGAGGPVAGVSSSVGVGIYGYAPPTSRGSTRLLLKNYPVQSVTSVTIDGVLVPQSPSAGEAGWNLVEDVVELVGYRFTPGIANVVVVYAAGFDATPPEVEQVVIDMVVWIYKARDRVAQVSKSVQGEVITFSSKPWPESAQQVIDAYRRYDR